MKVVIESDALQEIKSRGNNLLIMCNRKGCSCDRMEPAPYVRVGKPLGGPSNYFITSISGVKVYVCRELETFQQATVYLDNLWRWRRLAVKLQ